MDKYITKLKELCANFSYPDFISLLNAVDEEISNGTLSEVDAEFLYYFNYLMSFVDDQVVVAGKEVTLGNMLIENKLLNKEKITPTLLMYLYCARKKSLGLEDFANKIKFERQVDSGVEMGIVTPNDSMTPEYLQINNLGEIKNMSIDKYNYTFIESIAHEVVHIYQGTRKEDSDNIFDRITYYDNQIGYIILRDFMHGSNDSIGLHDQMLIEYAAEENAQVYMLETYGNRPDLFNQELLDSMKNSYIERKNEEIYRFPRYAQDGLLIYIENALKYKGADMQKVQSILDKITELKKSQKPLLKKLKVQGISEDYYDSYYNLYLGSFYKFDGKNIVMQNELNDISKGSR